jgi:hypothetical protein
MDMLDVNDSISAAKLIAPTGIEVKRVFNLDAASPDFLPTILSIVERSGGDGGLPRADVILSAEVASAARLSPPTCLRSSCGFPGDVEQTTQ